MRLLGFDLGSSFIKATIVDGDTGKTIARSQYPDTEMSMLSPESGWAEQQPEEWWKGIKALTKDLISKAGNQIDAIGISYQMHGLVAVDHSLNPVRPSIIWCDSRAAAIGEQAFQSLGEDLCLSRYLNSPGNFTASKMKWMLDNESRIWDQVRYVMLPGDFIAMKLTGTPSTTPSGLSEMILWDFEENHLARRLLSHYGISDSVIPEIIDTFSDSLTVSAEVANDLGIPSGIPVSYRAGDQPNNALSLNVFEPGEIATTAGTSGVVYGVTNQKKYDPKSRVNTFLHVNHTEQNPRYGVLMCVNGSGILNRWAKDNFRWDGYENMNNDAESSSLSGEIMAFPFGNGAERILENKHPGAIFSGINLNRHNRNDIGRAVQEGICFAFNYGIDIMKSAGISPRNMRAGYANMFLSDLFARTLSNLSGLPIQLYDTDGAKGAALASGMGSGYFSNRNEAFSRLESIHTIEPKKSEKLEEQYRHWESYLQKHILND